MSSSRIAVRAAARVVPALALLAGCHDVTAPAPAVARLSRPETAASVPDSVRAGQPFTVRLTTAVGPCEEAAPAQVTVNDQTASIRPLLRPAATCAAGDHLVSWETTVTFPAAGFGTVAYLAADGTWAYGLVVVP